MLDTASKLDNAYIGNIVMQLKTKNIFIFDLKCTNFKALNYLKVFHCVIIERLFFTLCCRNTSLWILQVALF